MAELENQHVNQNQKDKERDDRFSDDRRRTEPRIESREKDDRFQRSDVRFKKESRT